MGDSGEPHHRFSRLPGFRRMAQAGGPLFCRAAGGGARPRGGDGILTHSKRSREHVASEEGWGLRRPVSPASIQHFGVVCGTPYDSARPDAIRQRRTAMTPQEQQLVADLFDRLASLEGQRRDPDAERLIREGLGRAPNAVYALVQSVLVQDEFLKRANARIEELEGAIAAPAESGGSFLDSIRSAITGREQPRTSVPSVRAGGMGSSGYGARGLLQVSLPVLQVSPKDTPKDTHRDIRKADIPWAPPRAAEAARFLARLPRPWPVSWAGPCCSTASAP